MIRFFSPFVESIKTKQNSIFTPRLWHVSDSFTRVCPVSKSKFAVNSMYDECQMMNSSYMERCHGDASESIQRPK